MRGLVEATLDCSPFDPYFIANYSYDAAGNLLKISANDPELGLLMRLEEPGQPGQPEPRKGYDAEGRLHKIGYNKLDFGSDFAFYDVNDDCVVNYDDLSLVYTAYGFSVYQQGYNRRFDLNSDGVINSVDTDAATAQLEKTCPRFIYDADGNLMVLEGPKRMVYLGGIFEQNVDSGEVTKYYHTADGRRLAMRKGSTLSYFANDHLGGTSVVMNDAGGVVSRVRYYPYGNVWTQETGAPPTDRLFIGQRRYGPKSGIYHYGSRFYSADIGRFLQPDTIVPGAGDPQVLNRYSYVLNNQMRYSDPTGNRYEDGWTPNTPTGRGTGGDPILEAFAVVGQEQPFAYPRWVTCKPCRHANLRWSDMTKAAAETLAGAGWNVNLLPWSSTQRGTVAGWMGDYSVKTGMDAPGWDKIVDYLANDAPVPVIIAAAGAGGGIRPNWVRFEQTTGSYGKHKRIDSLSGTANWRVIDDKGVRGGRAFEDKSGKYIGTSREMLQIEDERLWASTNDRVLTLRVPAQGTTLSTALRALLNSGAIELQEIEFTR